MSPVSTLFHEGSPAPGFAEEADRDRAAVDDQAREIALA
jgi:hypothetical protein